MARPQAEQLVMHEWVTERLRGRRGVSGRVYSMRFTRLAASSSFECYEVSVERPKDRPLRLLLKDFGSSRWFRDEPLSARHRREASTYEHLLARRGLGTAEFYGSRSDDAYGHYWLLLEFVSGRLVNDADLEQWIRAVGWLGRLHGTFAARRDRLATATYLLRRDDTYLAGLASDAAENATFVAPRRSGEVERLVRTFQDLIPHMSVLAPTLVHGDYRAKQVLVDVTSEPPRLTPIDWEGASLGSGFFDVASITDGFEPPVLDRMFDAYVEEAGRLGWHVSTSSMREVVDWFRLGNVIRWLAQARAKHYTEAQMARVLEHGARILRVLPA